MSMTHFYMQIRNTQVRLSGRLRSALRQDGAVVVYIFLIKADVR